MNFLELAQRACQECGVSTVNITTVVSQTGQAKRIVDWVNAAWQDIQGAHKDWGWMRNAASFATVDGQAVYALGSGAGTTGVTSASFSSWARGSFRVYPTATGTAAEVPLGYIDYDRWRDTYQIGSSRTATSQPGKYTITPSKGIGLGPVPTAGYTVTADYFASPSLMSLDADIPALPAHYHLAIVYRMMMMYGAFDVAGEVYQRGESEYKRMMRRIENDYLPEVEIGGPLC